MSKKNNWNADAMQGTLISDMEQEVREGVSQMSASSAPPVSATANTPATEQQTGQPAAKPQGPEPTKGVQTYIALSDYQRLYNQKIKRDMESGKMNSKMKTTIANLAAEAIMFWLDVQEGKRQVSAK